MGSLSPAGRGPKWGSLLEAGGGGESERWSGKGGLPPKDNTFFRTRSPHCDLSVSRAALGYTPRAIKHFPCASLGAASAPPAAASRDAVWAAPKVVEWRVTALCTLPLNVFRLGPSNAQEFAHIIPPCSCVCRRVCNFNQSHYCHSHSHAWRGGRLQSAPLCRHRRPLAETLGRRRPGEVPAEQAAGIGFAKPRCQGSPAASPAAWSVGAWFCAGNRSPRPFDDSGEHPDPAAASRRGSGSVHIAYRQACATA